MRPIYLNNAATTYPKPPEVVAAVSAAMEALPGEEGRSTGTGLSLQPCRLELARLLHVPRVEQVVLLPSATHGLNVAIRGILAGCGNGHVITTALEHNSVLRPIAHVARERGLRVTHVAPAPDGWIDPSTIADACDRETLLIALTHASNVTGAIQPVKEIADLAAERGIPLVLDAAQSAGCVALNYQEFPGRVFVALAGHKGLCGPQGTGALVVPDDEIPPLLVGGTGVRSDREFQPDDLPTKYECGTPNLPGFHGLRAGVRWVSEQGVDVLGQHRAQLVGRLRDGLAGIPGVSLTPLPSDDGRAGVVSFTLDGWSPADLGVVLQQSFGIETRSGLHCAPLAHRWLGTEPEGTVRASVGPLTTFADVDALVEAVTAVVRV